VHVDAQQLAEQRPGVLRAVVGIADAARVADAGVQVAVGPELESPAAVRVVERVRDHEDDLRRRGVRDVRVPGGDGVARDRHRARRRQVVHVVHVEESVARVVRVEVHREQPLLVLVGHERGDVEKRRRVVGAVLVDLDDALLRDDEQPARAVVGHGDVERSADHAVGAERRERDGGLRESGAGDQRRQHPGADGANESRGENGFVHDTIGKQLPGQ
jgi:hypothetical protein